MKPNPAPESGSGKPWWRVALASGIGSAAVAALALWLPPGKATVVLAIGVVVFLFVLFKDPDYWYRRAASTVLGLLAVSLTARGISAVFQWEQTTFGFLLLDAGGWPVVVTLAVLFVALLIVDALHHRHLA